MSISGKMKPGGLRDDGTGLSICETGPEGVG